MLVVAAAGNDGPSGGRQLPRGARRRRWLSASYDAGRRVSWFSTRGDYVDLAAPGSGIVSDATRTAAGPTCRAPRWRPARRRRTARCCSPPSRTSHPRSCGARLAARAPDDAGPIGHDTALRLGPPRPGVGAGRLTERVRSPSGPQTASRSRAPMLEDGWRSFDMARASIWRIRSRVRWKCCADLLERARLTTVQAEAQLQDLALTLVERSEQPLDLVGEHARAPRRRRATPRSGPRPGRPGRRRRPRGAARTATPARPRPAAPRPPCPRAARPRRPARRRVGGTTQRELQPAACLLEPGEGVTGVHGQADRAAGVGDATGDRLADPPGGVGRELEALAPVELLHRVHQAQVALLDQVQQRQPGRLVLLGDRHHQAEVGLDERALRCLAPTRTSDRSSRRRAARQRRSSIVELAAGGGAGPRSRGPGGPRPPWSAGGTGRCRCR